MGRNRAKLEDTRDELMDRDDENTFARADLLAKYNLFPFTYKRSRLAEGSPMPADEYDTFKFSKGSTVAVEALILAYNKKESSF